MNAISLVIIARNEEANIERCILSASDVVDEIIVLDSGSKDRTIELAEGKGAKVFQVSWKGYGATKNEGNKLAKNDWILSLDADEALDTTLQDAIRKEKEKLQGAYRLRRRTWYEGRPVRFGHWNPDKKVRLFNRNYAEWSLDDVHEELLLKSSVAIKELSGFLRHFSYSSVEEHRKRSEYYADLSAKKYAQSGRSGGYFKAFVKAFWKFIYSFLLKAGFLDGNRGWIIASISARETFLKYIRIERYKS